jgi:hypothetical protein
MRFDSNFRLGKVINQKEEEQYALPLYKYTN